MKRFVFAALCACCALAMSAENWIYAPVEPAGPFDWQPVTEDGGFWVCTYIHKDINQGGRPDGVYKFSGGEWKFDEQGRIIDSEISNKPEVKCEYDDQGRIVDNAVYKYIEFPGDLVPYRTKVLHILEFDSEVPSFPVKWEYDIELNPESPMQTGERLKGTIEIKVNRDESGKVTEVIWPDQTLRYTYGGEGTVERIVVSRNDDSEPLLILKDVKWQPTDNQLLERFALAGGVSELRWDNMPFMRGRNIISSAVIENCNNESLNLILSHSYSDESEKFGSVTRGGSLYNDLVITSGETPFYHYRHWIDMHISKVDDSLLVNGIPNMYSQEAEMTSRPGQRITGKYRVRTDYAVILKEDHIHFMAEPKDFSLKNELKNGMTFSMINNKYTGYPVRAVSFAQITQSGDEGLYEVPQWIEYYEKYLAFGNAKGLGVESVSDPDIDHEPLRWYRLDGTEADGSRLEPGLYIRVRGSKSEKILVR